MPARPAPGAPPAAAKELAQAFFGNTFVRAEVVSVIGRNVHDLRIDQGRVIASRPGSLDLLERDGSQQTIGIGPATQAVGAAILAHAPRGLRIMTVREGDGPATQIYLAGAARVLGRSLFGGTLARAEVVTFEGKTVHDFRIDEGRVVAVRTGSIVLTERDGTQQTIEVSPTTQVAAFGALADLTALTRGLTVVTIREGDAAAHEIRILSVSQRLAGRR